MKCTRNYEKSQHSNFKWLHRQNMSCQDLWRCYGSNHPLAGDPRAGVFQRRLKVFPDSRLFA